MAKIAVKQFIALKQPRLSESLEAIEAHIRLIFGIAYISVVGIIICVLGIGGSCYTVRFFRSQAFSSMMSVNPFFLLAVNGGCLAILLMARHIIKHSFHSTRRSELNQILGAVYLCDDKGDFSFPFKEYAEPVKLQGKDDGK